MKQNEADELIFLEDELNKELLRLRWKLFVRSAIENEPENITITKVKKCLNAIKKLSHFY